LKARGERHQITLPAQIDAGGPIMNVQIRDVSAQGMMIHSRTPLKVGTYVEVITEQANIVGLVRWTGDDCFGIKTRDRVPVVKLVFKGAGKLVRDNKGAMAAPMPNAPIAVQHARSRALGRALDFGFIAVAVIAVALLVGSFALGTLAQPLTTITTYLR
jgi:hypothetical protein